MMTHKNFACLILTHGRADRVHTYKHLRKQGYTGKIYLVIDDEDEQRQAYIDAFGDQVVIFNKEKYLAISDVADTGGPNEIVLPARNACHDLAKQLGLDYFLELDDDYLEFYYRYSKGDCVGSYRFKELDQLFDSILDFLETSGAITVAFAQGGDLIGGAGNNMFKIGLKRKAMNAFFCKTDRPFKFYGRINEDATMNVVLGSVGKLIFTVCNATLNQVQTQENKGGLTKAYLDMGTYRKSFYSVMFCPSAVKIAMMGRQHKRIHHRIDWNTCVPKILNERYKKV